RRCKKHRRRGCDLPKSHILVLIRDSQTIEMATKGSIGRTRPRRASQLAKLPVRRRSARQIPAVLHPARPHSARLILAVLHPARRAPAVLIPARPPSARLILAVLHPARRRSASLHLARPRSARRHPGRNDPGEPEQPGAVRGLPKPTDFKMQYTFETTPVAFIA